jgi:hypothetical protein
MLASPYCSAGGLYITRQNIDQVGVVFAVRRMTKHTWINDRDQFLAPLEPLPDQFVSDCLVWSLFDIRNYTASAAGLKWANKSWDLVNHFIPFSEDDVGSSDRFESDFMVTHLATKTLSDEAAVVLDEGKRLWSAYFQHVDAHTIRAEWRLDRPDVGWYQVRNVLKLRNASGDYPPVDFGPLRAAHVALGEKLRPDVYEHGLLPKAE